MLNAINIYSNIQSESSDNRAYRDYTYRNDYCLQIDSISKRIKATCLGWSHTSLRLFVIKLLVTRHGIAVDDGDYQLESGA